MRRTTIMADEQTLETLEALAQDRRVSLALVVREALEEKARQYRPRPTCLGVGDSGKSDVSAEAGVGRTPGPSWR